jgi:uncharacterized protein (TIGR03118 family)
MHVSKRRQIVATSAAVLAAGLLAVAPSASARPASAAHHQTAVRQVNLVSDQPGKAAILDPNLVNPWGMSHGPTTPLWVSDNGTNVSTLYAGAIPPTPVSIAPLVVNIPGGVPTGQVFNDTSDFVVPGTGMPALVIFATESGVLSAWNPEVSPVTSAVQVGSVAHGVDKGLALVHSPFGPLLLATDFHHNRVDVYDSSFTRLPVNRLFRDTSLPRGYAPFNVAEVGTNVFITYAKQDAERHDDVAGAGHGFIDEYTNYGVWLRRFASRGTLNSPWGMVVAPSSFGTFAGDLLVGNFGNGRIHAFNLRTGQFEGALRRPNHHVVKIDGLWGLVVGDSAAGGTDAIWFSAGPDSEAHGLLGQLRAG